MKIITPYLIYVIILGATIRFIMFWNLLQIIKGEMAVLEVLNVAIE